MKSSTRFSRFGYKTALTLALLLGICCLPVSEAFLGFLRREPEPPAGLGPQIQVSPDYLQPHLEGQPEPEMAEMSPVSADPLQILVSRGIFPADALTRTTPINRAELASILVKALGHNMQLYSEFPFYRDVDRAHWAYVPIEIARSKHLIERLEGGGYYNPDEAVTYSEVYAALANAVPGAAPPPEIWENLLRQFEDIDLLPDELLPAVAKLSRTRFFTAYQELRTFLHPDQPVAPADLAPLITYLMHVTDRRDPLVAVDDMDAFLLPAGLSLSVTPSTAIYESRMAVGQTFFFSLVYPVSPLPKGSRLRGIVRDVPEERQYVIELTEVQTPQDVIYRTSAELVLIFDPEDRMAFIVPGEIFSTVTRKLPGDQTVAPAMPVPVGPIPAEPVRPAP